MTPHHLYYPLNRVPLACVVIKPHLSTHACIVVIYQIDPRMAD